MRQLLLAAVGALALASCSLGVPHPDDCASSDECRAAFGAGTYCEPDTGRCESVIGELCPEIFPDDIAEDRDAILFGTILLRSSANQRARERAIRLAVGERAIDGHRVGLLHCDAARATAAADFLIDRVGVPAIIGPSSSSDTEAVFSAHRDDGVLVMSPSATARQLTTIDNPPSGPGLLWRTAPPDNLQAQVILGALGPVRVSVIARQNDTYAQGLSVILQEGATMDGLSIVATPQFAAPDQIATAAESALGSGAPPDVVVFISSRLADAAAFLDASAAISAYDGVSLFFSDAGANDELLSLTGASPGAARYGALRATRPSTPDTIITSEFVSAYQAASAGEDPLAFSFTAQAYDAMALVLVGAGFALGRDGAVTGAGIAEGLTRVSSGAPRQLLGANFNAIIGELRGGATVDVIGASGSLDYDADEELSSASYDLLAVDGAGPDAVFRITASVEAR